MKQYRTAQELRLVGKAWEIRYQLRKLAKQEASLKQLLSPSK